MAKNYIRPEDCNFTIVHKRIRDDRRMWPHFKCCIGAIDDTHIGAILTPRDYVRYIGRSGTPTQNMIAVIDFDMRFTYVSIGQPGSMRDTSVLFHVIEHDTSAFPLPPHGIYFFWFYLLCIISSLFLHLSIFIYLEKYCTVDVGYLNRFGYLAPYKGQMYHISNWRRGAAPCGEQEIFNYFHSSILNVIERAFRVWKMKWKILLKMPSYPMPK
jgi:hypothetical protein